MADFLFSVITIACQTALLSFERSILLACEWFDEFDWSHRIVFATDSDVTNRADCKLI